jgi:hypothetical protein
MALIGLRLSDRPGDGAGDCLDHAELDRVVDELDEVVAPRRARVVAGAVVDREIA